MADAVHSGDGTSITSGSVRSRDPDSVKKTFWEILHLRVEVVAGLSTTLLAVAAFFGISQLSDKNDAQRSLADALTLADQRAVTIADRNGTVEAQKQTITDQASTMAQQRMGIESLTQERDSLVMKLESVEGTSAGPTTDEPSVRQTGSATLTAGGRGIDLDAERTDFSSYNQPVEISFLKSGEMRIANGAKLAVLGDAEANYASCKNAQNYSSDYASNTEVQARKWFCVYTSEGRYSSVRINGISDERIGVDVVTWP